MAEVFLGCVLMGMGVALAFVWGVALANAEEIKEIQRFCKTHKHMEHIDMSNNKHWCDQIRTDVDQTATNMIDMSSRISALAKASGLVWNEKDWEWQKDD